MPRKKRKTEIKPIDNVAKMFDTKNCQEFLDANPEYQLTVDPENKYNMSERQKNFIKYYVQFKSIPIAMKMTNIETEVEALEVFNMYSSQQEIRRLNKAMYLRQFNNKMLSINQIGGWLSSILMDDVPLADRIDTNGKLRVAQMLIDLNKTEQSAIIDPGTIMTKDIKTEIKNLSLESIRMLIDADKNMTKKNSVINDIKKVSSLTMEEVSYLQTLSYEELLKVLETINQGGEMNGK